MIQLECMDKMLCISHTVQLSVLRLCSCAYLLPILSVLTPASYALNTAESSTDRSHQRLACIHNQTTDCILALVLLSLGAC